MTLKPVVVGVDGFAALGAGDGLADAFDRSRQILFHHANVERACDADE